MRETRRLLFDSYKAARGKLEPLFSPLKSEQHMQADVKHFILPALAHRRHRFVTERLSKSQQRSMFRTNVSLVLQEARRRGHYRVAAAALDVALAELQPAHLAQDFDPAWVKDAVAACQSVAEMREIEGVLRRHERLLLASGSAAGTSGFLLTAAFGRGVAGQGRERRLGDDSPEALDDAQAATDDAAAPEEAEGEAGGRLPLSTSASVSRALQGSLANSLACSPDAASGLLSSSIAGNGAEGVPMSAADPMARVSTAITQPPSAHALALHGGHHDGSLWATPDARAAAGLRRLQRRHTDVTAGPNVSFTRYFIHQNLVRGEAELMALYQALRSRPQDVAFRVVGGGAAASDAAAGTSSSSSLSSPYAAAVHALLQRRRGIQRVPWLPAAMGAYTLDTRDSVGSDVVESNRHLLRSLARERLVVYQSLSSMLPVLYLDPQPGEAILDLCASPGNKTGLILDTMNGHSAMKPALSAQRSSSCVVANEAQPSRLHALQERLRDLSPDVAVTRGQGQLFGPPMSLTAGSPHPNSSSGSDAYGVFTAATFADDAAGGMLGAGGGLYDGVLVDAPCSGEGRLGRDALSWRLWHPGRGLEFFPLQCALLMRAVQLCKIGGRVVYATCTLNPIENEAVVAAVVRACGGAVELVPPPAIRSPTASASFDRGAGGGALAEGDEREAAEVAAPRLSHGLHRWDVPSSAGGFLRTAADAYAQGESRQRVLPEMFAPDADGDGTPGDADGGLGAALHRCCRRVMPHLNGNADGFFVVVLRKKAAVVARHAALAAGSAAAHKSGTAHGETGVAAAAGLGRSPLSLASTGGPSSLSSASSLALSLAGGSNLLNDRGLVRLQASHPLVLKHLGGFFAPAAPTAPARSSATRCATVRSFLETYGWTAMWCEGEGLRLLSTPVAQLLHSHTTFATAPRHAGDDHDRRQHPERSAPRPAGTDHGGGGGSGATQLVDAGVLVVTASGELTERGAALLCAGATQRVIELPLRYAQLLLANRVLEVGGSLRLMPAFMQEAERAYGAQQGLVSPRDSGSAMASDTALQDSPLWCRHALLALPGATAGNAIVTIKLAASDTHDTPAPAEAWAAPLRSWSWPVRMEVVRPWSGPGDLSGGLVRLHLSLPPASRHRVVALVGRLQGHAHRLLRSAKAQQQRVLEESAAHDPSLALGTKELYGVPLQPSHQHRQLLHSPSSVRVEKKAVTDQVREEGEEEGRPSPSTVFEL